MLNILTPIQWKWISPCWQWRNGMKKGVISGINDLISSQRSNWWWLTVNSPQTIMNGEMVRQGWDWNSLSTVYRHHHNLIFEWWVVGIKVAYSPTPISILHASFGLIHYHYHHCSKLTVSCSKYLIMSIIYNLQMSSQADFWVMVMGEDRTKLPCSPFSTPILHVFGFLHKYYCSLTVFVSHYKCFRKSTTY